MAEREYLDIDIPLHLREKRWLTRSTVSAGVESLRDEANRIIRAVVEQYRTQGWTPERSIDALHIYRDKRMKYRRSWFLQNVILDSARITFHRDKK